MWRRLGASRGSGPEPAFFFVGDHRGPWGQGPKAGAVVVGNNKHTTEGASQADKRAALAANRQGKELEAPRRERQARYGRSPNGEAGNSIARPDTAGDVVWHYC